jgi:hypothetical protein
MRLNRVCTLRLEPQSARGRPLAEAAPNHASDVRYGFFVKSTVGASRAAAFVTSK